MKSNPKNLGRAFLGGKLQTRGLSRGQSMLIVNVTLEPMTRALKRGLEVKFPLSKLERVEWHFGKLWDAMDDWLANRDQYTIVHEMKRPELGGCSLGRGRNSVL
jgi:hypothetical protein